MALADRQLRQEIREAMAQLRMARWDGDGLKIALAEAALNNLLDRYAFINHIGEQHATKTSLDTVP